MMTRDEYNAAVKDLEQMVAAEDAVETFRFNSVRASTRRVLMQAANEINSEMRRLRAGVWEYEDAQRDRVFTAIDGLNASVQAVPVVDLSTTVHTIGGKVIDHATNPGTYGRTHDMDCPGCAGTSFTASPRSETYWSS
jgi:hypothetical protein